jgi:hypothetical protein
MNMPELSPDYHFEPYLINRGRAGQKGGCKEEVIPGECKKENAKYHECLIDPCPAKITRMKRRKHEPVNTLQARRIRKKRIFFY